MVVTIHLGDVTFALLSAVFIHLFCMSPRPPKNPEIYLLSLRLSIKYCRPFLPLAQLFESLFYLNYRRTTATYHFCSIFSSVSSFQPSSAPLAVQTHSSRRLLGRISSRTDHKKLKSSTISHHTLSASLCAPATSVFVVWDSLYS